MSSGPSCQRSTFRLCLDLLRNTQTLAVIDASCIAPIGPSIRWEAYTGLIRQMASQSDISSQSSSDLEADSPTTETAAARPNRSGGRRRRKVKKAKDYDETHPEWPSRLQLRRHVVTLEAPLSSNFTPVTVAIEVMMGAFPDHVFQLQGIKKDHRATAALLMRLRFAGFQASASPSIIKNEGLSAGVLAAARKHVSVQLPPDKDKDGITADPRCIWSRLRLKGWTQTILLANVY